MQVELVPSVLVALENESLVLAKKTDASSLVIKVNPCLLFFVVDFFFAAIGRIYSINDEVVLTAVHPLDQQGFCIRRPVGHAEILVFIFIEIRPGQLTSIYRGDADANCWVGISSLWIAGVF